MHIYISPLIMLIVFVVIMPLLAHQKDTIHWAVDYFVLMPRKLLESVKLIAYAESLGGVESLITYPMLQTHGDLPVEVREKLGITEDFLRLSVGIENADDLIADLEQALA